MATIDALDLVFGGYRRVRSFVSQGNRAVVTYVRGRRCDRVSIHFVYQWDTGLLCCVPLVSPICEIILCILVHPMVH